MFSNPIEIEACKFDRSKILNSSVRSILWQMLRNTIALKSPDHGGNGYSGMEMLIVFHLS